VLNRLVAFWNAGGALVVPLVVLAALEDVPEAEAAVDPERSRFLSERLPRNCGVTNEAKFSAAVTPVRRSVFATGPRLTVAVRIAPILVPTEACGDRFCHSSAAHTMTSANSNAIHSPFDPGPLAGAGALPGRDGTGVLGEIRGAEILLMSVLSP